MSWCCSLGIFSFRHAVSSVSRHSLTEAMRLSSLRFFANRCNRARSRLCKGSRFTSPQVLLSLRRFRLNERSRSLRGSALPHSTLSHVSSTASLSLNPVLASNSAKSAARLQKPGPFRMVARSSSNCFELTWCFAENASLRGTRGSPTCFATLSVHSPALFASSNACRR